MTDKTLSRKVLNVLRSGKQFSPTAIAKQLRTTEGSISARVAELRSDGYPIYSNIGKDGQTRYRWGRASSKMVAAAYAAFGSQAFQ